MSMNGFIRHGSRGEVAVGIIAVAGLVMLLMAGGLVTQYLRTQALPPEQSISKNFTFSVPDNPNLIGEHTIEFTVTDGLDTFTSDPVTVIVTAKNQAPVVNAGDDMTVRLPLEATLSGVVSDDGLPNVPGEVVTAWSKTSGPGDVAFSAIAELNTTATFSVAGTYVIRLMADDGQDTAYDELTVIAEPAPPAPDLSLVGDRSLMALSDSIVVSVYLEDATPFANWAQYLEFDNTKLELTDQQQGDFATFIADTRGLSTINSTGEVRAGGFSLTDSNSGAGNLGIFTFRAIGTGNTSVITANKSGSKPFGNALSETDSYEIIPDIVVGQLDITIVDSNSPPTVSAGDNQEIELPTNSVTLNGSVTDDGLPDPPGLSTTLWSKVSGPGDVTFGSVTVLDTTATFSAAGTYLLRLTGDDGELSANDDMQVIVRSQNLAPIAVNDSYDAVAGESLTVDAPGVLSNDSDPNDDTITARLLSNVAHGDLTLQADGSFLYLANDNYSGTDSFTYEAYDGSLASTPATVTINVTIRNAAPVVSAGNNVVVTLPDVANLNGTVSDDGLPNPPGAVSTLWSKVSGPGSVTFGTANAEDSTATFSEAGTYVLRLTANDGELLSVDDVQVTVNTAPTAVSDAYDAWQAESLTVNVPGVLDNDADADGDVLTALLVTDVANGELALNANGSFQYMSNINWRGVDSFTYQAFDGNARSEEVTVEITVSVRNTPPVVSAGNDQTVNLPNPAILSGTVEDDGEPIGGELSVLWSKTNGPGDIVFANANQASTSVTFDVAGEYTLRLLANDGQLTTYDEVNIGANTVPVAQDDNYEAWRAELLEVGAPGVLENDSDADGDSLEAQLVQGALHGDLILNADGSFTYSSDNFFEGLDSFTYVVSDGNSTSEIVTVEILVNTRNAAPDVTAGDDQIIEFGSDAALSGVAEDDGNPEDPGALTVLWTKISGPGEVSFADASVAETTAAFSEVGEYVLRLSANDGELMTADEVTILTHTAPEASAGDDLTLLINEPEQLLGYVSDDGLPSSSPLSVEWTVIINEEDFAGIEGTLYEISDPLTVSPQFIARVAGEFVLRLTVNDGNLSTYDEVTITAQDRIAEIEIPGQTRLTVRPGMTVEIPFTVRTNIIGASRLLLEMTQGIYNSFIFDR